MSQLLKKAAVAGAVGVIGSTGVVALVDQSSNEAEAVYHNPWSRQNAYDMGFTGLHEPYRYAQSWWIDNDRPDSGEGADCSGYAGKVWAAPAYTAPGTNYGYPSTEQWYPGNVDGSVNLAMTDSRTRQMDVWVRRTAYGGSSNHMGVFEGTYSAGEGGWKVWHAASPTWGITDDYYSNSYIASQNMKRFKRMNW